jgi:hypothetical protein
MKMLVFMSVIAIGLAVTTSTVRPTSLSDIAASVASIRLVAAQVDQTVCPITKRQPNRVNNLG